MLCAQSDASASCAQKRSKAIAPSTISEPEPPLVRQSSFDVVAAAIAGNPQRKIYQTASFPGSCAEDAHGSTLLSETWPGLVATAIRASRLARVEAASLILRGRDAEVCGRRETSGAMFRDAIPLSGFATSAASFQGFPAHVTLLHNSNAIGALVAQSVCRAETLHRAGAFTHHYTSCGVEEDDFADAILHAWQLADNYGYVPTDSDVEDET